MLNVGGASELGTVFDPPGNPQAAFPGLAAVDTVVNGVPARKLFGTFQTTRDDPTLEPPLNRVVSTDGGVTFPAASYKSEPPTSNASRLRDGTLIGYGFKPVAVTARTATYEAYRSTDEGATWTTETATFHLGAKLASVTTDGGTRTHSGVLELPDGTILITIYGTFADAAGTRAQLQASTDGGRTFTRRGVIAEGTATDSYNEAAIAQLPNGNLLSVIRHHKGTLAPPVYTTSVDGQQWAAVQPLQVSFPYGYDPFDDATGAFLGIAPQLLLMPNGVMVLSSGRPDNWVAMSTNGVGTGWVGQLTYRNCPAKGFRLHGSTGNTDIAYVGGNRAIQVGDNCDVTWACSNPNETDFTVDKQNRIWRRFFDVLTPDVGKIDLATKYRLGRIAVIGDMTSTVPGHPRARVDGAFDGSTEYWSSAVRAGGAGSYVIQLDRQYDLTRIGLSLRNGRAGSGRVSLSIDGITWSGPVVDVTDRTHLAMEYFPLTTPVAARYVRVEVDASGTCDSGLGSSCAFLNELELYSTINSFENDPVNNRPRGYTEITSSWATRSGTGDNDSASALRIVDNSADAHSKVVWAAAASATKTLEFRLKPLAMPNGFLFDVLGRNPAGATVTAYHLAVQPDGSIARWTGQTWQLLSPTGLVKVGTWQTIRVQATTTGATIAVGDTTVANGVPPSTAGAVSLFGHRFASAGTKPIGGDFLVDDVLFGP